MIDPISRRAFVGTVAGGALASTAGALSAAHDGVGAAENSAAPPPDLVIDAAAPLASPARAFDAFRAELQARRAAGFDAVLVPVARRDGMEGTLRNLTALHAHLGRLGDEAALVHEAGDLARLRPRVGVIATMHGLHMIGEQLDLVPQLRANGVRVMQLTGYWKNWLGDGCFERGDTPLTGLGRMAVRAIADAGVVLDLAQAGRRTSLEALSIGDGPVLVSRANAARIHDHPQNLTDAQIDAVRARGGVIAASAFPVLLSGAPRPTVDDLVRHIRYFVERVGIDHVGIGLDFDQQPRRRFPDDPLPDPPYAYPAGLSVAADLSALRERLAASGFIDSELHRLLGGNLARLF